MQAMPAKSRFTILVPKNLVRRQHEQPSMTYVFTRLLGDEELRPHLERGDTIAFKGLVHAWREIERQIERLGFQDTYAVSRTRSAGTPGKDNVIRVSPLGTHKDG